MSGAGKAAADGPRLTVVAGPTASGKSALALALAEATGAELVSADSQQVYRAFDLGTAKPSPEELARVPHHLISVVDPTEPFDAARFQALADAAIADITSRGKPVIVVGGTGLYLRVLLHGVVDAPPRDPALRAELEACADAEGEAALHARLAAVDPITADRLPIQDRLRIIRALEIHAGTGKPASALREAHAFQAARYPYRLWVLQPEREALYRAINARAEVMYRQGLLDEVRALIERGYRDSAPMRSVGYVQALDVVEGRCSEAEGLARTQQATRHYAKRQLTWFRKETQARLLTPPYDVDALVAELG